MVFVMPSPSQRPHALGVIGGQENSTLAIGVVHQIKFIRHLPIHHSPGYRMLRMGHGHRKRFRIGDL